MPIALVSLVSPVHEQDKIRQSLKEYQAVLDDLGVKEFTWKDLSQARDYEMVMVFVKSGGSENLFKEIYARLPQPIYLLSTPLHNSLAASMEILSWVKAQGGKGEIIHGHPEDFKEKIMAYYHLNKALKDIPGTRCGVIGEPSDWLIASSVNKEVIFKNWGLNLLEIEMEELIQAFEKVPNARAQELARMIERDAEGMVENSRQDLIEASKVYYALRELVARYDLKALTVRCFDLVTSLKTTGCLALALLNNEGIIAGCEGDLPATISMYLAYKLTAQLPFMANPVSIDEKQGIVEFAHCTIATNAVEKYILRSHFETGLGVGIQGILAQGPVTIFKLGGENLDNYVVKSGEIIENTDNPNACRTQVKIKIPAPEYFLTNPLANHHILIPGDYSKILFKFFQFFPKDFKLRK